MFQDAGSLKAECSRRISGSSLQIALAKPAGYILGWVNINTNKHHCKSNDTNEKGQESRGCELFKAFVPANARLPWLSRYLRQRGSFALRRIRASGPSRCKTHTAGEEVSSIVGFKVLPPWFFMLKTTL